MRPLPFVLAFLAAPAMAQVTIPWTLAVDGGGPYSSDASSAAAIASNGDLVVAGGRATNAPPSTALDPFLVRIGVNGTVAWSRTDVTAAPADAARSVAISSVDGSIHVLSSPGSFGQTGLRLAKYDGSGNPAWSADYTAPAVTTLGAGVVLDAFGNTYVAGAIGATGGGQPVEVLDLLLESRDASGNLRWTHLIDGGAGKGDSPGALAACPGDQFVVVGAANQLQSGPSDASITRFDAAGNVVWTRTRNVVAGATHLFQDVAVDASGTAYVLEIVALPPTIVSSGVVAYDAAGNVVFAQTMPGGVVPVDLDAGAGCVVLAGNSGSSVVAARFTTSGALSWTRTWSIAGPPSTTAARVRLDAAGQATIAGYTSVPHVQNIERNFAAVRYAPDGTQLFSVWFGAPGNANDLVSDLRVDATGAAYVAGSRRIFDAGQYGPGDVLVARIEPQSFPLCLGDGTGAACPCGNSSPVGSQAGCTNSSGNAARLSDSGFASLSNDTLVLSVGGETPNAPTVVIQGTASANSAVFGDGLRCAGGQVLRMYTRNASSGVVHVPAASDPSVSARAAALGHPIAPGTTRVYQSYYRDPNPSFCASPAGATWNLSNGLFVRWGA